MGTHSDHPITHNDQGDNAILLPPELGPNELPESEDNQNVSPPHELAYGATHLATQTQSDIVTRSSRTIQPMQRYLDSMIQQEQGLVAWEVLIDQDECEHHLTAEQEYKIQLAMSDPITFAASTNPSILYMHEAPEAPDRDKFLDVMTTELEGHACMGNFSPYH